MDCGMSVHLIYPSKRRLLSPFALSGCPSTHLQQQQVIQVLLRIVAVLADAPDGERLPGTLSMPQVIGTPAPPWQFWDSWEWIGSRREDTNQAGAALGVCGKAPTQPSTSNLGSGHCPRASLQIRWGIASPLPSSPGAKERPARMASYIPSFTAIFTSVSRFS